MLPVHLPGLRFADTRSRPSRVLVRSVL